MKRLDKKRRWRGEEKMKNYLRYLLVRRTKRFTIKFGNIKKTVGEFYVRLDGKR